MSQFTTETARDAGTMGGKSGKSGLNLKLEDRLLIINWLQQNGPAILRSRPSREAVCQRIEKDLNLNIGIFSLRRIMQAIGFKWTPKRSVTEAQRLQGKRIGNMQYSVLCQAVRRLCKMMNVPLPAEEGENQNGQSNAGFSEGNTGLINTPATTALPSFPRADQQSGFVPPRADQNSSFTLPAAPQQTGQRPFAEYAGDPDREWEQ